MKALWNWILRLFGYDQPKFIEFKPTAVDEEFREYSNLLDKERVRQLKSLGQVPFNPADRVNYTSSTSDRN